MPTYNDRLNRLNTDLHDLTAAMDRVYREIATLQSKKEQEIKQLEDRHNRDIARLQREYEAFSRRMVALKRDIQHDQAALEREQKQAAANDNKKLDTASTVGGKQKRTSAW